MDCCLGDEGKGIEHAHISRSKVLATKPDNPSSIPRTHKAEGENRFLRLPSDPYGHKGLGERR